jgi:tetratricopeptide (TPR) repeat protein
MKHTLCIVFLFFFGSILLPGQVFAQDTEMPTDDLGNVTDMFQEHFFEALKQRAIENYELALTSLSQASKATKDQPALDAVIAFEQGKNLVALERFDAAEEQFKKVQQLQGDRLDVLEALYDLYYVEQDLDAAIPLVIKLSEYDEDYKEDLANLYSRTRQYDKAIQVLDELDANWGESDYRDALRSQIYRQTGNTQGEIVKLEEKIEGTVKSEKDYLNLIYLYSEQGNSKKAFETAKELLANKPQSQLVHVALYKFYLEENDTEKALQSMKTVFGSSQVEEVQKYKVLADFIQFVDTHPEFQAALDSILPAFSAMEGGKVYLQLGDYYLSKQNHSAALRFYEMGVARDPDNYNLLKNTLLLQIDEKKFEAAERLSEESLAIFPAQPLLYLLNGVANNGLNLPDKAIDSLTTGVDFLLDDPKMQRDFYLQLSLAYTLKGDTTKAANYTQKANEINLPN